MEEVAQIAPVFCRDDVVTDFYGKNVARFRLPGPFAMLKEGTVYQIDPRKQNRQY